MIDNKHEGNNDIAKCLRLYLRLMKVYMRVNVKVVSECGILRKVAGFPITGHRPWISSSPVRFGIIELRQFPDSALPSPGRSVTTTASRLSERRQHQVFNEDGDRM